MTAGTCHLCTTTHRSFKTRNTYLLCPRRKHPEPQCLGCLSAGWKDRDRDLERDRGETGRDSDREGETDTPERLKEGTHREVQETPRKMEADRLKALVVEAGRARGRDVGIFKNSEEGGSGNWGFQCQHYATFSTSSHKVRVQGPVEVSWDAFLWL